MKTRLFKWKSADVRLQIVVKKARSDFLELSRESRGEPSVCAEEGGHLPHRSPKRKHTWLAEHPKMQEIYAANINVLRATKEPAQKENHMWGPWERYHTKWVEEATHFFGRQVRRRGTRESGVGDYHRATRFGANPHIPIEIGSCEMQHP
ncbi:hypothetical protein B0H19DRAFT_1235773 [Mycena capillaripes]|nr:hypothetical protein B0H19DRAFT_1235773 [Mycena capillaripes]